jgi:hypothetical protein
MIRERGFTGNTATFIEWITAKNPEGYYASIPEDDRCWHGPWSRGLCAPCFGRDGSDRKLSLYGLQGGWGDGWVFVAFREVPQST